MKRKWREEVEGDLVDLHDLESYLPHDEKFLIWLLLKNILFDMSKQEQYGVHVYIFRFPEHILPTLVCMFIHG